MKLPLAANSSCRYPAVKDCWRGISARTVTWAVHFRSLAPPRVLEVWWPAVAVNFDSESILQQQTPRDTIVVLCFIGPARRARDRRGKDSSKRVRRSRCRKRHEAVAFSCLDGHVQRKRDTQQEGIEGRPRAHRAIQEFVYSKPSVSNSKAARGVDNFTHQVAGSHPLSQVTLLQLGRFRMWRFSSPSAPTTFKQHVRSAALLLPRALICFFLIAHWVSSSRQPPPHFLVLSWGARPTLFRL